MKIIRLVERQVVVTDVVEEEVTERLRIQEEMENWRGQGRPGWGAQTWLANRMGCASGLVNGLMRGKLVWTIERQAKAAVAFGIPAEELFAPV